MIAILFNRYSGKSLGNKICLHVEAFLDKKRVNYTSYNETQWPENIDHFDTVYLIGGDGTINYFINKYSNFTGNVGLFPGGTGNDFFHSIHKDKDIEKLTDRYLSYHSKLIDVGICNDYRFLNAVGLGFDGQVLRNMNVVRLVGGHIGYLLVVLKNIITFKSIEYTYTYGNQKLSRQTMIFYIGNGRSTGGGFLMTPMAKTDDGQLDIVLSNPKSLFKKLILLIKVQKGVHLVDKSVTYWQDKSIHIKSSEKVFYQVDGELKSDSEFFISILPQSLSVLV